MVIEVLYFEGCPHYRETVELLERLLLEEGLSGAIVQHPVTTHEEAVRVRFLGSPTIRVDGEDVEVAARSRDDFGVKCRLYSVSGRLVGLPNADTLRAAICAAREKNSIGSGL